MRSFKLRFLAAFLSMLMAATARADQDQLPLIQWTPGDPPVFDFYFPNHVHLPPAVKVFQFVGEARSLVTAPTTFDILVYFDYVDATGATILIPPPPFGYHNVRPADGLPHHIEGGPYILDFCPQQVSIHFEITSEVPIVFDGLYDHTCIHIPEPTSLVLFGLACAGVGFARRRHG
jgi:hypothetical protein